jgi:hypothetical protein
MAAEEHGRRIRWCAVSRCRTVTVTLEKKYLGVGLVILYPREPKKVNID